MGSIVSQIQQVISISRSYYRQYISFGRNYTGIYPVQLGSFGFAQACCNVRTRQLRTVKVIDLWKDMVDEIKSFDDMETIHQGLIHENIVRFYQSFQEEQRRIMSYELVDGPELFEGLLEQGPYTTNHVRHYMSQILKAVEYCHENNIIHRSLTPQRFMLLTASSTVKLLNLYTAVTIGDDTLNQEHCISNPKYSAPEVNCLRPYGKPADIYACGLILYNMLSGIHLYQPDESIQVATKKGPFGFGREEWEGVVEQGKDLIVDMIAIRQNDRVTASEALQHQFFTLQEVSRDKTSVPRKLHDIFVEERLLEMLPARNPYDNIRYLLNINIPINSWEL